MRRVISSILTYLCTSLFAGIALATCCAAMLYAATNDPIQKTSAQERPKAWLGVALAPANPDDIKALSTTPFTRGCARVNSTMAGTPANDAGIKGGDLICSVNEKPTPTAEALIEVIRAMNVGTKVVVKLFRDKKLQDLKMVLAPRPGDSEEYLRTTLLGKPVPEINVSQWIGPAATNKGSYSGHITLIDFWEPWCGPCRMMIPWVNKMHEKHGKAGLQVIGLATEPVEDLKNSQKELSMNYPIGFDQDGAIKSKFLVTAIPTMLLIDQHGKLVDLHIGAGRAEDFEKHLEELLKSLKK